MREIFVWLICVTLAACPIVASPESPFAGVPGDAARGAFESGPGSGAPRGSLLAFLSRRLGEKFAGDLRARAMFVIQVTAREMKECEDEYWKTLSEASFRPIEQVTELLPRPGVPPHRMEEKLLALFDNRPTREQQARLQAAGEERRSCSRRVAERFTQGLSYVTGIPEAELLETMPGPAAGRGRLGFAFSRPDDPFMRAIAQRLGAELNDALRSRLLEILDERRRESRKCEETFLSDLSLASGRAREKVEAFVLAPGGDPASMERRIMDLFGGAPTLAQRRALADASQKIQNCSEPIVSKMLAELAEATGLPETDLHAMLPGAAPRSKQAVPFGGPVRPDRARGDGGPDGPQGAP